MDNWKKIAIVVGVVLVVAVIAIFFKDHWVSVANAALKTIQDNIGLEHQFQIPE